MTKANFPIADCNDYGANTMIAIGITLGVIGTFLGLAVSKSIPFSSFKIHTNSTPHFKTRIQFSILYTVSNTKML